MLPNVLSRLVKESGKTQKQIAAELGLSSQRFNYYVTGRREPDMATLSMFADFFNVTIDYLLGRDSEQKNNPDAAGTGDDEIYTILSELTPANQEKLLEIARLYRASQQPPEEK